MVKSVNGDRGSSVIPIDGDDYMYLGRGKHVIVDGSDVKMSGTGGTTIVDGITGSGTDKVNSVKNVSNSMRLVLLEPLPNPDDYTMHCEAGWAI